MTHIRTLLLSLFLLLVPLTIAAQVEVRGTVIDKERNEPLAGASVLVKGGDHEDRARGVEGEHRLLLQPRG